MPPIYTGTWQSMMWSLLTVSRLTAALTILETDRSVSI